MHAFTSKYSFYGLIIFCFISVSLLRGEEQLFFLLDDRNWQIGFQDEPDAGTLIIELTLSHEEITDWTELFTIQCFKDLPVSASDFISLLKKSTEEHLPKNQSLRFQIIQDDPLYVFESSFIYPTSSAFLSNDEYNIGCVLKGENTLYYLRYSTKKANIFEKNLDEWVKRLEQAYLASTPRADQQGNWLKLTSTDLYKNDQKLTLQTHHQFIYQPEKGFGIALPKEWLIKEHSAEALVEDPSYKIALSFSYPTQHIEGNLALLEKPLTVFQPRVETIRVFKKQHPQVKVIGKGNLHTILGQEGTYILLAHDNKIGWITFFQSEHQIYRLAIWTPRDQFKELKTEIEKVILNFQIAP